MGNTYTHFQEVTAIKFVVGKDENGTDLALTRASWKQYDKNEAGEIGPDHGGEGETLFVGSVSGEKLVTLLSQENIAEDKITTFIADGVVAA